MSLISIDSQIVKADDSMHYFERSLTTRFGQMLTMAQEIYGSRVMDITILGFDFIEEGPVTSFLGSPDLNLLMLHLPISKIQDYNNCLYMLAHETIHCLSMQNGIPVTRLEEGLATLFAKNYMNRIGKGNDCKSSDDTYNRAHEDVEELLKIDPDIIKKARKKLPCISLIKGCLLYSINPKVEEVAMRLCTPFYN
jgi:hypothetical protein